MMLRMLRVLGVTIRILIRLLVIRLRYIDILVSAVSNKKLESKIIGVSLAKVIYMSAFEALLLRDLASPFIDEF